jgi:hypothetical protein
MIFLIEVIEVIEDIEVIEVIEVTDWMRVSDPLFKGDEFHNC